MLNAGDVQLVLALAEAVDRLEASCDVGVRVTFSDEEAAGVFALDRALRAEGRVCGPCKWRVGTLCRHRNAEVALGDRGCDFWIVG